MKILFIALSSIVVVAFLCIACFKLGKRSEAKQWKNTISRVLDEKRKIQP